MIEDLITVNTLPPDCRGMIHKLEAHGVGFNVLFSKAGSFRGGDWHPNWQYNVVVSGRVEFKMRPLEDDGSGDQEVQEVVLAGSKIVTPPRWPHLFYFCKDTVMLEWWSGPFSANFYAPYRWHVEQQLKMGSLATELALRHGDKEKEA